MVLKHSMTSKEVVQALKADGWVARKGGKTSHKHFKHPTKPGLVTVSMHTGDIPLGTLKRIARQSGLSLVGN
jgi:predicted RNA binding protein YcfA (HicA-like mRNA interferase family)